MDNLVIPHISDLHMGNSLLTAVLNRNPGQQGHDPQLCRLLSTRLRFITKNYRITPQDLRWIISGDLTRSGDNPEFQVVKHFMTNHPPRDSLGRPLTPTLGISDDHYVDVPGNHDHWNGWDEQDRLAQSTNYPPPAFNLDLFQNTFRQTAWDNLSSPWESPQNSIRFELFGVDSNSGLAGQNANRLAKGMISDGEFASLEDALKTSNNMPQKENVKTVRTIICHHAFWGLGLREARPLKSSHVSQLTTLAARYRVATILTGHTHREAFQHLKVPATPFNETQQRNCSVYEIRSPTTLQGLSKAGLHGFWVHHLYRENPDADVIWAPTLYKLASGRFQSQTFANLILP